MTIIDADEPMRRFVQVPSIRAVLEAEYARLKPRLELAKLHGDTVTWIVPFFIDDMNEGLEVTVSGYTVDDAYDRVIEQLNRVLFTGGHLPGVRRITRLVAGVQE